MHTIMLRYYVHAARYGNIIHRSPRREKSRNRRMFNNTIFVLCRLNKYKSHRFIVTPNSCECVRVPICIPYAYRFMLHARKMCCDGSTQYLRCSLTQSDGARSLWMVLCLLASLRLWAPARRSEKSASPAPEHAIAKIKY